jgi:hypothetical protein
MRVIGRFVAFSLLGAATCPTAAAAQIAAAAVTVIQISKNRAVL